MTAFFREFNRTKSESATSMGFTLRRCGGEFGVQKKRLNGSDRFGRPVGRAQNTREHVNSGAKINGSGQVTVGRGISTVA